jgi:hypothetical protein
VTCRVQKRASLLRGSFPFRGVCARRTVVDVEDRLRVVTRYSSPDEADGEEYPSCSSSSRVCSSRNSRDSRPSRTSARGVDDSLVFTMLALTGRRRS